MRRRFFWSMLGVAALALVVVAVVGALTGQLNAVRQARIEITRQAVAVAGLIQEAAEQQPEWSDLRGLLGLLRTGRLEVVTPEGENRLVRLLTAAQQVIGGSLVDLGWIDANGGLRLLRNPDLGRTLSFEPGALLAGDDVYRRVTVEDQAQAVLAVAHPFRLAASEGITPVVVVAQPSDLIDWRGILQGLVVPLAVAAALSAVAAGWMSAWLGARLDALAAAAQQLADGDPTSRAPGDGDDEIAEVARSFNVMADRLEETQQREREFLMSVGHDLRTPLTTIGGYAEALEEGGLGEEETGRIAAVLTGETSRLRRLVADLMLLARLEAQEFTLRPEAVDVGAHLAEVAEGFAGRAAEARVELTVDIEPTGRLVTDPDRLAQIAANLLENALRYTPEAGVVGFSVRAVPDGIEMSVSDSGPGIEPEDLSRVFERFYVARKYRRVRPEGSGLGLSIVKQLVEALQGRILVEANPGQGTRFRVSIPASAAS